ncbi:glycosyltransferase family 39 protein [Dolichospermum sp. ST_con]|nr:glycosyltransferase family 39 protein [Dolichospermum sp. ST_con]MDD1419484.1 glycosyltransferase family 39 protein [Dolichospermum sp. ST_sed1]MDD1423344.1 glycosyltransferase family 39 protein [Dolichospermum sp. ST_sed9]MDD1431704.1 glycosyltransferase family 39 protein [Dolichospermum sp. ST_sed6]MDD1435159.1 glycosyltransferase family 39 protein [Dolichospermum sp. ST_sed10]MDD1440228.1 glycosyltransferase family 39 protein [Dolichospermum sp. ST_sed3]MDD1449452.1 glycosyltransferase 
MFLNSPLIIAILQLIRLFWQLPYCKLLLWLLPLLLFTSGETSLMAHDETLYALRARQIFETGDWVSPWGNPHHKTPGFYWLIAIFYQLFGVSDTTARIPTMIAGILSIFVIYQVGEILLSQKLAFLGMMILSVEFLWVQYCRLSTPDLPTILLVFIGIFSLLKSDIDIQNRHFYGFITGLSFGLGFLMRSLMIFLPMVALLPYLIIDHRRHRHLTNPMLYLGFLVGLIPTLIWLYFSWLRYGSDSIGALLGFVIELGSHEQHNNGILFYVWNLALKSFPWLFFSLLGLVLVIRRSLSKYPLILIGFPVILFIEISIFSTRFSHYSLGIYPFIAFLAAVGLDWLGKIYQKGFADQFSSNQMVYLPRNISYAWGILGIILVVAGTGILVWGEVDIHKYAILLIYSGFGSLIVPLVWIGNFHYHCKFLTSHYWLCGLLISCWLSIATAGNLGLLGDFNPKFRIFYEQESINKILHKNPINFVKGKGFNDKESLLIYFYTPHYGKTVEAISQLPVLSYAWIYQPSSVGLATHYRVIGSFKDYQLIQVLSTIFDF